MHFTDDAEDDTDSNNSVDFCEDQDQVNELGYQGGFDFDEEEYGFPRGDLAPRESMEFLGFKEGLTFTIVEESERSQSMPHYCSESMQVVTRKRSSSFKNVGQFLAESLETV